jgi:hypothetical protein
VIFIPHQGYPKEGLPCRSRSLDGRSLRAKLFLTPTPVRRQYFAERESARGRDEPLHLLERLILATSSIAVLHLGQPIVSSRAVSELSVVVACILTSIRQVFLENLDSAAELT